MSSTSPELSRAAAGEWKTWSPGQRETFLAAIARHRRASWRVTGACAAAVVILAFVVAILMAPLFYAVIGLGFDVVNLITPAPDVIGWLMREADALSSSQRVPPGAVIRAFAVAALPGLFAMAAAVVSLRHVWKTSPLFNAGDIPGRPPNRSVLAEARLADVVEEMAIAAGIPAPRVVVVPGGINAAACGRDEAHVTLFVTEGLAESVDREQLEGMLAHVVGCIVNGDMTIGLRVTTTLSLFGLVARVGSALTDRHALRSAVKLWRVLVAPTSADTIAFLDAIVRPFDDSAQHRGEAKRESSTGNLTWREWLLMPLMGPLVLTGFLSGLVAQMFLEPLVALAWRQRKYMADATAVQLTRDPDALAGALAAVVQAPTTIAPWTAHLAVVPDRRGSSGAFGWSMVPIFPPVEKRVAALCRMGAHVSLQPRRRIPLPIAIALGGIIAFVAALMCVVVFLLVVVSTALSGLFTLFPASIVHILLRWAAR